MHKRYQMFDIVCSAVRVETPTAMRTCFFTGIDTDENGDTFQVVTVRHKEIQGFLEQFICFFK